MNSLYNVVNIAWIMYLCVDECIYVYVYTCACE
jgi:hypothetical protein